LITSLPPFLPLYPLFLPSFLPSFLPPLLLSFLPSFSLSIPSSLLTSLRGRMVGLGGGAPRTSRNLLQGTTELGGERNDREGGKREGGDQIARL
jgi:hypothetical protein